MRELHFTPGSGCDDRNVHCKNVHSLIKAAESTAPMLITNLDIFNIHINIETLYLTMS